VFRSLFRAILTIDSSRRGSHSLPRRRRLLEQSARLIPVARGIEVEEVVAGGVRCEWVEPAMAERGSVVVYLHGGAFCLGSPESHRHLVSRLSKLTRLSVIVPDYRLAPEHPFPAALEDSLAVYRSLRAQGYAPEQIALAGDSAGANLLLSLLLRLKASGEELPACAVCFSPVTDLDRSSPGVAAADRSRGPRDPMLSPEYVAPLCDAYVGRADRRNPLLSPIFGDLSGLPPLLLQAGGDELLLPDSERLAARAEASGVRVKLEVYPKMWHAFQTFVPILPSARRALAASAEFLIEQCASAVHGAARRGE
jgi:epsilon-lactone hydrolase